MQRIMIAATVLALSTACGDTNDPAGGTDGGSASGTDTDAGTMGTTGGSGSGTSDPTAASDSMSGGSSGTAGSTGGTEGSGGTTGTGTTGTDGSGTGTGTSTGIDTDGTTGAVEPFPCLDNENQKDCEVDGCVWDVDTLNCVPPDIAEACETYENQAACEMFDLCQWDPTEEECVDA